MEGSHSWSSAAVLKTAISQDIVGSNPTPSATLKWRYFLKFMDILIIMLVTMFFGGLLLVLWGLCLIVGFGWAMFIIGLISLTGGTPESFAEAQRDYPGAKTLKGKLLGLLLVILGITSMIYSLNIQQ